MRLFNEFEREVIKRFEQYQLPVIELKRETPKEAVCLVFERVNTGGVALNVFELLTATFAADDFPLRDDWNKCEQRLKSQRPVLRSLQSDDFLQAIALLVTQERRRADLARAIPAHEVAGISCKRKDILRLEVADWQRLADLVEEGFARAARFLHGQKIFKARDLPYRAQLVPLAAILVDLGPDGETEGARQKLARWYWCGVLGELYGSATETRFARDLPEVVAWVRGEAVEPITVRESSFQANRLLTLRTRNSAAYKGLYALLMRDGARDFRTGEPIEDQTFFDDKVDIHHLFPKRWCRAADLPAAIYHSVINNPPWPPAPTARSAAARRRSTSPPWRKRPVWMQRGWTKSCARTASSPPCCAAMTSGPSLPSAPRRCSNASRRPPARTSRASRRCSSPAPPCPPATKKSKTPRSPKAPRNPSREAAPPLVGRVAAPLALPTQVTGRRLPHPRTRACRKASLLQAASG
jgi:hypothetical protein